MAVSVTGTLYLSVQMCHSITNIDRCFGHDQGYVFHLKLFTWQLTMLWWLLHLIGEFDQIAVKNSICMHFSSYFNAMSMDIVKLTEISLQGKQISICDSDDNRMLDLPWIIHTVHVLLCIIVYDDVIKWKHFPRYWPFVRGIHRSPDVFFDLRLTNSWAENGDAGDLRRNRAYYDVIVMFR